MSKYNSNGVFQWTRQSGTPSDDQAYGVAMDADGFIYIAGTTGGNMDGSTNKGGFDMFVLKYSATGDKI